MTTNVHNCHRKLRPTAFLCSPLSKRKKLREYPPYVKMNIAPSWILFTFKMRLPKHAFRSGSSKCGRCLIFSSALLFFSFFFCTLAKTMSHFCDLSHVGILILYLYYILAILEQMGKLNGKRVHCALSEP